MKKVVSILLICVMLVSSLTACGSKESAGEKGVSVYIESPIATLDPYGTDDYVTLYVCSQVYEALIRCNENGEIIPWLAKSWNISDDGLTYSFELEQGVKFQNGEELKASDAVYSVYAAKENAIMDAILGDVESAEATGDYSFELHLKQPNAGLLALMVDFYIVNEKYDSAQTSRYNTACGTGAYKLREGSVNLSTEVIIDRFDDYHLGAPAIPYAVLKIITDSSTARVQMETGELDFLMVYSVSNYEPLASTGNYNTALVNAPHCAYVTWNLEKEPLNNKALRQALTYATDKKSINQIAYEGLAVPATALFGETSFGADFSNVMDLSFDLEKAKEKLAEAGFPNGLDFDDYGISIDYIGGSYHEKIANCLQETWSQIGVHVSIQAADNVDCSGGNYTMRTTGVGFTADMSTSANKYISSCIGSSNYARYSNARVDELFTLAAAESDSATRKAYYEEVCEIITEDCPYLCIQHKQIPYVWNKKLNAKVYPSNTSPWYIQDWSWAE